jgi:GT2 family glycosyltransferase
MKLSIITVTWNSQTHIKTLIESVQAACADMPYEHIIVDNASADNTVNIIKQYSYIKFIGNTTNKGFGAANNQGVAESIGDYILFLNPDMELFPGSLCTMLEWMDTHPDVGIASPKLVDVAGLHNQHALPRKFPWTHELVAQVLKLPHIFPHILDRYLMVGFDGECEQDVDSVRGACMFVRREVIDTLGWGFDPRYFIWYEDVDLCREVWAMGKRVVYTPVISVVDFVGQSFVQQASVWKQRQFTQSMLIYMQKWEPWYKWVWIWIVRPIGIAMVWVSNCIVRIKQSKQGK